MAIQDYLTAATTTTASTAAPTAASGTTQVTGALESLVGGNSAYIENARRRGLETAAARGGINSSIAAGAAERAAIEASGDLASQAVQIDQSNLAVEQQDWLAQNNFNRELFGNLYSNAYESSSSMLNALGFYALADPETYTPEVMSGFSNYFSQLQNNVLSNYYNV